MLSSSTRGPRRLLSALLVGVLAASAWGLAPTSASAAVAAPYGLSPAGTAVDQIPTLSWSRVDGATTYDVQLSTSADLSNPLVNVSTTNAAYVPTTQLPGDTELFWQVRARFSTTSTSDWAQASFRRGALSRPTPLTPADGTPLQPPQEPVTFRWSAIGGATAYDVEVGTDPEFTDPTLSTVTQVKGTTYSPSAQQAPRTYHWRVRARVAGGLVTPWSSALPNRAWSYTVLALPPAALIAPADDPLGTSPVRDVVLDWRPVPGAATYDLQLSTDQNFLSGTTTVAGITGTRYSPPTTLNNDQYYWRVRPVDLAGHSPTWGDAQARWHFRRYWPEQPRLEHPTDGATVSAPMFYQWAPAELASSYTLQVSPTSSFTSSTPGFMSCTTTQTTYTPDTESGDCMPAAAGSYYWRVLATDLTPNGGGGPVTQAIYSQVRRFSYNPDLVTLTTPVNGATISVPTLRWEPLSGAARYKVSIAPVDSAGTSMAPTTTAATSFTPRTILKPGRYRWQVQTVSDTNVVGAGILAQGQRVFTVEAPPTPEAPAPQPTFVDTPSRRFPTLTWTPVTDATRYEVRLRPAGTQAWNSTALSTVQPAVEDLGTAYLTPDRYEFQVDAYQSDTFVSQGAIGSFTIAGLGETVGHRVALSGTALDDPTTSCGAQAPSECQNLRQTPVLRWSPVPNAGSYTLIVSRDAELTNIVGTYGTHSTIWTPTRAFADSNAGSAYYWSVLACTAAGRCTGSRAARHQFNMLSNPVQLLSPDAEAVVADDVTLDWADYLTSPGRSDTGSTLSTRATTEAAHYRIQTSTSPQFTTFLDNAAVDQTTFTSFGTTYPEGPIYWRVQAADGAGNPLTWSAPRMFVKRSPEPVPLSPVSGIELDGGQNFSWEPLPFAASYNLEVYRNDDTVPSPANRVLAVTTKQTSHSPITPLPAASSSYRWRVQRVDARGRVGGWSPLTPFSVAGTGPAPTSPVEGERQDPNGALFTWKTVDRASSYRFERRAVGSTSSTETRVTAAGGWAPLSAIGAGSWEWRVVALDAANAELGASGWRGFTVIDKPATAAPQITGSGQIGTSLTSTPPSWNLPDVATTYQWYRGSTPIAGATTNVYDLTQADLNQSVKVRVSGTKPGYPVGTADSNVVKGGLGVGPSLARELVLEGTGKVGTTISGTPVWQQPDVTTAYQWLIGGTAVSGATASTFTVRTADVGQTVQLRATGTRVGYSPTTVTSNVLTATGNERLVASSPAKVSGIARLGSTLTASPGTWTRSPGFAYQWLRDGVAVPGATGASHVLTIVDAGRLMTVRVTARRAGYLDGTSTSAGLRIAKVASRTGFTLADRTISRTTYPRASVTVTGPVGAAISGTVSVYDGSRRIKYVTLSITAAGKVTISTPRLSRGTHYLSVGFGGNTQLLSSRSAKTSVKVS